jgi:hypothetical protein
MVGIGLAAIGLASYVGGKNLNPTAMNAGFTQPGSAILPDQKTGDPAIPIHVGPPLTGRPTVPSRGYFL